MIPSTQTSTGSTTPATTQDGLNIRLPDSGTNVHVPVSDFGQATPGMLLSFMQDAAQLPREEASRPYAMYSGSQRLAPAVAFRDQGVGPLSQLIIDRDGEAAHS